ncbi:MAG: DNA ligase [Idiomarina sp.]|nr:DNA ligase [Idiomarina sp.]
MDIFSLVCCNMMATANISTLPTHPTMPSYNYVRLNVPPMMHADIYQLGSDPSAYWVSEKLDGVRAWWDGRRLWSRQGHYIPAPHSLLKHLPEQSLDGELWLGRGRFQEMAGLLNRRDPNHPLWQQVRFGVFDLPLITGPFELRKSFGLRLLPTMSEDSPVFWIPNRRVASATELDLLLRQIIDKGGEGLMLHHEANHYTAGRSPLVRKYKPVDQLLVEVIGYTQGRGRNESRVGALVVQLSNGDSFRVGSGLTDELRDNPPSIGTMVCVQFSGLTQRGIPRFPRYIANCEETKAHH